MSLTTEKYWRNGQIISAKDLNKLNFSLLYLDNKIISSTQLAISGQQYQTYVDDVIQDNIVYSSSSNQSIVYFSPNYVPIGILAVTDNNQSYNNVEYSPGNTYVTINNNNLTGDTLYISYFYTNSNITFDQLISNIIYLNAIYPAMYVLQYINIGGNYGFNIYEYPYSSYNNNNYNPDGTLLGQYFFGEDNQIVNINQNNISFYIATQEQLNNIPNLSINVGDIFYFSVLVPEPQTFGSSLNVIGNINVSSSILPIYNNLIDIGTFGEISWDSTTSTYQGIFRSQFRNIVGTNIYSDYVYSNQLLVNQINNLIFKRLLLNNITGEITTDNRDLYIKLDQYNETSNTGVSFKVGRQDSFSTTINISDLVTNISVQDLLNVSLPVETITNNNNQTIQRLGYFTNIPNVGDVVYLNKQAIIDYISNQNPELIFTSDSYNYQFITQSYTDTTGNVVNITLTISNYIQSINSNNVEYYEFLIYNTKNTPYFSSGSINNFTSAQFDFTTFIVALTNMNADISEIQVNGITGNTNISLYQWNTNTNQPQGSNLVQLSIIDYDDGIIEITPITPITQGNLSTLGNLQSISFIYPLYKLSVKNSSMSIGTRLGKLNFGSNIGFIKNNYLEPLVTYISSGMLNFTPTSSSQTITLNQNVDINDVEIILTPITWQYINNITPSGIYDMSLTYQKQQNNINVQFLVNAYTTSDIYSNLNYNINKQLYNEKINTVTTYNSQLQPTNTVLNNNSTDKIGMLQDQSNQLLRIPVSILSNSSITQQSLNGQTWEQVQTHGTNASYVFQIISNPTIVSIQPTDLTITPPTINGLSWFQTGYGMINNSPVTQFTNIFSSYQLNTQINASNGQWIEIPVNISQPTINNTTTGCNTMTQTVNGNNVTLNWNYFPDSLQGYYSCTPTSSLQWFRSTDGVNFTLIHTSEDSLGFYTSSYTDTNLQPGTYYYYAYSNGSWGPNPNISSSWVGPTKTPVVQAIVVSQLKNNPTLTANIGNTNVQSGVTVPYSISLIGGTSTYNLNITYNDGGQGTVNTYGWTTDSSNNPLTNLHGTAIYIDMEMELSKVNITENVKQNIVITATDVNTNQQVASYTLYFTYTNVYTQPVQNPSISISGLQSDTIVQNKYYTFNVSVQNAPSNYTINLSYNNGGEVNSSNKYSWVTDVNGNPLNYTNSNTNYTLPLQLQQNSITTQQTFNQSITAKLLDGNGNVVQSQTASFIFQTIQQPVNQQNNITIVGLDGNTFQEGNTYSYNIQISGNNAGMYFIKASYNAGGGQVSNKYSWTTTNNGTNLNQPFYFPGNETTEYVMQLDLIDSNNITQQYSQSLTVSLFNNSNPNTPVSTYTTYFTFNETYIQPPSPTPTPPSGNFTLSVQSSLQGNNNNTVNYKSTYSTGNMIYVQFMINGVASSTYKQQQSITPGTSGSISIPTPPDMTNVTGIFGQLTNNIADAVTPIATYTIPQSQFTITQQVQPTITLSLNPTTVISGNPFSLSWTIKGSGTYNVNITAQGLTSLDKFTFINGSQTVTNLPVSQGSIDTVMITKGESGSKTYTINQTMSNSFTGQTVSTQSQQITVNDQVQPYQISSSVNPTSITLRSSPYDIAFVTINATAPGNGTIKIIVSNGQSSITAQTINMSNSYNNTIQLNFDQLYLSWPTSSGVQPAITTGTITCQLLDTSGNIQKTSSNTISVQNPPIPIKPVYTSNTLYSGFSINNSVGQQFNQDNANQPINITQDNNSNIQLYVNGSLITTTKSNSNNQTNFSANIQNQLNYGSNSIQIYLTNSTGNFNQSLNVNNNNILNGQNIYVQTYNSLLPLYSISCYQYNITNLPNESNVLQTFESLGSGVFSPDKLVLMQNINVPVSNTTYAFTTSYSQSQPLVITTPQQSNANVVSVTLQYGPNNSTYTHKYNTNQSSYNITIYPSTNPTTSISTQPYNITTNIGWGDGTKTTLTTAQTQSDTGIFNITSMTVEYLTISNNFNQIPVKGTVKYLILGKTL